MRRVVRDRNLRVEIHVVTQRLLTEQTANAQFDTRPMGRLNAKSRFQNKRRLQSHIDEARGDMILGICMLYASQGPDPLTATIQETPEPPQMRICRIDYKANAGSTISVATASASVFDCLFTTRLPAP